MSDTDIAWLAGLYEGEGTLWKASPGSAALVISMQDEDVIRRCLEITGMGQVSSTGKVYGRERRPRCQWVVSRRELLLVLLPMLYPYLGSRRKARVDEILDQLALGDRRRKELPCGTLAGYRQHIRRKESTCDPCKAARREAYAQGLVC
jgi:hypothetical protein